MTLEQAQMAKYDRLCQQMNLKKEDHVLEIGSGWGGNAIHMAKNYGCYVTSVTISEEQCKLAKERVEQEGLSDKINIVLRDYRYLSGQFDKIVSIEMLEAVGAQFYDLYFKKCHELLKKDGILAIQVITCPDSRFESLRSGVDWIQKHIFPGSLLPSVAAINRAVNNTGDMTLVDLKDMGLDYARTLEMWRIEFNKKINEVKQLGFDDRFIRKWNYYLSYCEGAFAMRNINVMQMVYSRPNNTNR
jgi:cyclopropane-fatty-acyl-phospholipid synthase